MSEYKKSPQDEGKGTQSYMTAVHHRWPLRLFQSLLIILFVLFITISVQGVFTHHGLIHQSEIDYGLVFHQKTKPFTFKMD